MQIKVRLGVMVAGVFSHGVVADSEGSLGDAFLAQCKHTQSCAMEKMRGSDMDPAMLDMIESRMQGQCEAQVSTMESIEAQAALGPHAEKIDAMKGCYLAVIQLSCDVLNAEPDVPECEDV